MQANPKKSSSKPSIFVVFSFLFALLAFAGCHPDPLTPPTTPTEPNPPLELEKKILDFYVPFKNIVINEGKRQIIIYETKDFNDYQQITPIIEVSDGVSIQPASESTVDATKPVTYTLTASDGSKATYALIVCNVEWEYLETFSGAFSITGMGQFKEPWTAISQNGVLSLHFGEVTASAIDIYVKSPISSALVRSFSVGNYTPANVPNGKAGATFIYRENGVEKTFASPLSGSLEITGYDAAKSTISGNFKQIQYTGVGTSSQGNTYLSGTFKDLPLVVK